MVSFKQHYDELDKDEKESIFDKFVDRSLKLKKNNGKDKYDLETDFHNYIIGYNKRVDKNNDKYFAHQEFVRYHSI